MKNRNDIKKIKKHTNCLNILKGHC